MQLDAGGPSLLEKADSSLSAMAPYVRAKDVLAEYFSRGEGSFEESASKTVERLLQDKYLEIGYDVCLPDGAKPDTYLSAYENENGASTIRYGEGSSAGQDSALIDSFTGGVLLKIKPSDTLSDIFSGNTDFVPEAIGTRISLEALDSNQTPYNGWYDRMWDTMDLHGMERVIDSLQFEINKVFATP